MNNYAEKRLLDLSFDEKKDYGLFDTYSGESGGLIRKKRLWSDEEGNLCIGIVDLDNQFITYAPELSFSKSSREILHIKRLANPEPEKGKYRPGKIGQGVYPCFWNFTLEAYKKKKQIKTLVITEGYLKSYILDKSQVLSVGLPGITVWKEKGQNEIFKTIQLLCETCGVENIVWLTDGDTMKVEWKENKDLSKRSWSFFSSVRIFKEMTLEYGCEQFWMHIQENILHKGIDDLILAEPESIDKIKKELIRPASSDGIFFKRFNVGALSFQKIKEYFGIDDGANGFYKKYEETIGSRPFVYGKGIYQFNDETNKLEYIRAGESAQYIMVDSTYYIKGALPTLHGNIENVLRPTKPASINKKFQHKSKSDLLKIYHDIPHYDGFINRPDHLNYQKEFQAKDIESFILKYYNKYQQLSWNPKEGNIDYSLNFVKHIFGHGTIEYDNKIYNEYDLGLDYIQLLYTQPMQRLYILCLVSEKRATGKTKFWEWMNKIFQQNVVEINSEQLNGQFTTYFANALLCYIDEAFIDKIQTIERVKALVTSAKNKLEGKFTDADRVDNFLKVGLSSNNVRNFANISTDEVRFWVREVPEIAKENYDPNFEEKLYQEIPAFLHYLKNRSLVTERKTRSWFALELIETEALTSIKKESRSSIEILLEMVLRDYISSCEKAIVKLSPSDIRELINDQKISLTQIRWGLLRYGIEINPNSNWYIKYKSDPDPATNDIRIIENKVKSATYKIYADKFFSPEECALMLSKDELLILEEKELKLGEENWFNRLKNRSILIKDNDPIKIEIINKAESYKAFYDVINNIEPIPF